MKWTKEIPTASGFYWIKADDGHTEVVRVDADETQIESEWGNAVPQVYVEGKLGEIGIDQFVTERGKNLKWYGPINPPEEFY